MIISLLLLLFTFYSSLFPAPPALCEESISVDKPLDPLYINYNGSTPGIINVDIDIGEARNIYYNLEGGRRYHVYLVGEWIDLLDPQTDYDIFTYAPDGVETWHTESAGLPEQVANDAPHQFFETTVSGSYRFEIVNDERDSNGTDSAVFMLIEHIDTDVWYSRYFVGRYNDEPVFDTIWSYEFNTDADRIRVIVNVSETLDMYEARLYPMANPEAEIGYSIMGVPVPTGSLLMGGRIEDEETGIVYGGYNTSIEGYRDADLMASCEYKGEDMEIWFELPEAANQTDADDERGVISYYLVLIAERGEGVADFYIQTDFTPPNVTLIEPPEKGYALEETRIEASIQSKNEIRRVWANYTDDGGETWRTEELRPAGELHICDLPPFKAGVYVNYTIDARDELGNVGSAPAGFPVKNPVTLSCSASPSTVKMGETVEVRGTATPPLEAVTLRFTNGDHETSVEVNPDDAGTFSHIFEPKMLGEWRLQALFNGSETCFPASSPPVNFTVESTPTSIVSYLSAGEVKQNRPITLSGTVTPPIPGLNLEVTFASPTSSHQEIVTTEAGGVFSCRFKPPAVGAWNVIVQLRSDGLQYAPSQSDLMEFFVTPLGPAGRISDAFRATITPPYQYLTIGLTGAASALAIFKGRDHLIPLLPASLSRRMTRGRRRRTGHKYRRNRR